MGRTLSADTTPEAEAVQLEILRDMPPWRKVALVEDAIRCTRDLLRAGLRRRHPGASAAEVEARLRELWLGPELAGAAYGRSSHPDGD